MIAAAAAVTAAIAAGSSAAIASTTGAKPGAPAKTMSASEKPGGSKAGGSKAGGSKAGGSKAAEERQGHDAITAAVAQELQLSTARVSAALRPLFAAGQADTSSPIFSAAARSLGVSTQQLSTALGHAKQSLAGSN
jgi:hypothetical protein